MKALILSGRMVQDQELIYPYYRLQAAGFDVTLAAEWRQDFTGIQGVKFTPDSTFGHYWDLGRPVNGLDNFDLLVVPGGVKCMEHVRLNEHALETVRQFVHKGKMIACICSGAQLLISAGVVAGRQLSAYYAMRVDVENADAEFIDAPAVVDNKRKPVLVSSPHYKYVGQWMEAVLQGLGR